MTMKLISRILIVGLGSAGHRHLRLARKQFPDSKIKILRSNATNLIPELSDGCFINLEDAINFAPQIGVIANPSSFHMNIAQEFAQIGVHMLVEKPLSNSLEGVLRLIETCKESNSVLMTGYNLRFSTSLRYFHDQLVQKIIGNVLSVRCEVGQYLPTWRPETDYRQGVSARRDLGGGVLLELSHEFDYLRWIFGEVDWVRATLSHQSSLDIDVEDSAHLTLGFLRNGDGRQLIGTLNLDFIRHDQTRTCIAIGEKGSLRWDGIAGEVSLFNEGDVCWERIFIHKPQNDESYLAEWQDFINCIYTGSVPSVTGEDGLRVLEIIESARTSSITGAQESISTPHHGNR